MQKKVWLGLIALLALISPLYAQSEKTRWVDSVFNTLDLDGKIGQLMIVPVESHADAQALEKQLNQIKKQKIGSIVFTSGGPRAQLNITNTLQAYDVPLLIGTKGETSLDSVAAFPPSLMLGSLRDDSLLYFTGSEISKRFMRLGVHFTLGPNADVNNSINAFGENESNVASKAIAYQNGLRTTSILSIPTFTQTTTASMVPLQQLLRNGSAGVVMDPQIPFAPPDRGKLLKSKLTVVSNALLTHYSPSALKKKTNFDGLVITSIPNIEFLNKKFRMGDAEVILFKAGNDMLLFPKNTNTVIRRLRRALRKDKVLQSQLEATVKKILSVKYDAGLNKKATHSGDNLIAQLNTPAVLSLQKALFEKSVVVVKNEHALPIQQIDNVSFASLSIGGLRENILTTYLTKYAPFDHYKFQVTEDTVGLEQNLVKHDWVVVAVYPTTPGLENLYPALIQKISNQTNVIVVAMGSPTELSRVETMPTIIQAYTDHELVQQFIPQLIFGAKKADAVLPITVSSLNQGQGVQTSSLHRIGYAVAEAEGVDSKTLLKIASIAREAIEQKAAPGCQVIVARHGKIVYEKSFGAQTYDNGNPINDQTIYDLASVSKVMGTLQGVMFLYEKGLIDIYKKASVYLPELQTTNKKDIILKDVLTHQSGLAPFLLMWPQTAKGDTLLPYYYSTTRSEAYPLHVAPDLYASTPMKDSIWSWIVKSDMLNHPPRTPYTPRYSDLGFMIMHRLVERLTNQPMEDFLSQNLYEPLGANTVGYIPLNRFPPYQIAPTETDTIFRKATVIGTVHDERAAMLGGVAGHAGLFGSAVDLIKVGQMLLQGGSYGGQQYYRPETIELFAQKQFENSTRGLGWAKPGDPNSPSSRFGSTRAFGHTGFTGTCIWMDPEFDLVFVFLSNSRFPYRSAKLNTTNIRSRIQDTIYQSIFNYCQYGDQEPDRKLMEYLRKTSN
jgi:beta-N-acetylhexosaminidase